jgi:hypothetical protein
MEEPMRKLKLNLGELEVESFAVASSATAKGTVRGAGCSQDVENRDWGGPDQTALVCGFTALGCGATGGCVQVSVPAEACNYVITPLCP